MKIIHDQTMENEVLVLDDVHLMDCELRRCRLVYNGGDFKWTNTKFQDCRIELSGAAEKTAAFLAHVGILKTPSSIPPVSGQVH